jgi:hypothetical protein
LLNIVRTAQVTTLSLELSFHGRCEEADLVMKAKTTKVSGGCLCGRIRYEAEVFLQNGYACHCTICQKSTGQPAEITVLIKAGTLKYLEGVPKYYASSASGKRGFCGECGSRIVWQASNPEDDWSTNLCVGSLDRPSEVSIACHIYADTQLPWYDFGEDLPKFAEKDFHAMMAFIKLD